MSNPPCRVCGRELDDMGTCVCATRRASQPPPAPWSWITEEEADALRAALHSVRRLQPGGPAPLAWHLTELLAPVNAAHFLANAVEELLVELPRRRLQADPAKEDIGLFLGGARPPRGDDAPPLASPPCVCECGAQFAFVEGLTESRACCVFCSQRKRRERLAADAEEALWNRGETRG